MPQRCNLRDRPAYAPDKPAGIKTRGRNINVEMDENANIGQRIADKVAEFGGSWTFIIIYVSFLVAWMSFNTFVLVHYGSGPEENSSMLTHISF